MILCDAHFLSHAEIWVKLFIPEQVFVPAQLSQAQEAK
jgi:hypothetical protein